MFYNFLTTKKHLNILLAASIAAAFLLNACAGPDAQPAAATEMPTEAGTLQPRANEPTAELPASLPECGLPLPGPEDWPVFICDTFNGERDTFPAENQDNPYARYSAQVTDGQLYEVDYTAKGFAQFQRSARPGLISPTPRISRFRFRAPWTVPLKT